MDPSTQGKSARHMVKSKTKSISNRGAFFSFSKNRTDNRIESIISVLKMTAWNWSGSHLFCYGAWGRKMSANSLLRVCAQIKLAYPAWNLSDSSNRGMIGKLKEFEDAGSIASPFRLTYLGKIEATLLAAG